VGSCSWARTARMWWRLWRATGTSAARRRTGRFGSMDFYICLKPPKYILDFYWIDPIEAAKRFISTGKPKFAKKLYTKYERQDSVRRPGKQAFGRAKFRPIQGWFFNLHNSLTRTLSALHCYSCSMRAKYFLASTDPTIQSIVSFKRKPNAKYV
jgi:hypothetical protein